MERRLGRHPAQRAGQPAEPVLAGAVVLVGPPAFAAIRQVVTELLYQPSGQAYDALKRLTAASYSDGPDFSYTYDAAGNTLQLGKTIAGQTSTTVYTYDIANQLATAQEGSGTAWQYQYDGNGSLVETTPGDQAGNGAKRYSYNTAGQLTNVETHDGSAYQPQAEMAYDGLGQRLSLTGRQAGQSLTTRYLLDGSQTLAATANGQTTYYLSGVGEYRADWIYYLADGTNTARQITDPQGQVTFMRSFTPWGEVLEQSGQSDLTTGYLGGTLDAATGLIYMGNGQYYDPKTGRFLTRNANPTQTNPYVPWKGDPAGAMLAPIALLAMVYGGKKKRNKWNNLLILMVLIVSAGISLAACNPATPAPNPVEVTVTKYAETPVLSVTAVDTQTATVIASTPTPAGTPSLTPVAGCLLTFVHTSNTPTQLPSDEDFRITIDDLRTQDMAQYLSTSDIETDAMLLARLVIGEASEGDMINTREEKASIIWVARIRASIGYSKYVAPGYKSCPVSTSIKEEVLATGQFDAITKLKTNSSLVIYENYRENYKSSNVVRMANPYNDIDMARLKEAYHLAQEVMGQDIRQAPDEIKDFDTYLGIPSSPQLPKECRTYEDHRENLRPYTTIGQSAFYDCAFVDNYHLFKDFSLKNGYLPPEN